MLDWRGIVGASLLAVASLALAACDSSAFIPRGQRELEVLSTSPREGSTVEEPRPLIHVVFSRELDPETVGEHSVRLHSEGGGAVSIDVGIGSLTPTMVSVVPARNLDPGHAYVLVFDAVQIRDLSGQSLARSFEVEFETHGRERPNVPVPGGGGGPTIPGPDPGSVIYAGTCTSSNGCPNSNWEFLPDGGAMPIEFDGLSAWSYSRPSPRLHGGARVFLRVRPGSATMPSGQSNSILEAVVPDRAEVVSIIGNAGQQIINSPHWAKDESFISYNSIEWNAKGTLAGSIYKVPVTWTAGHSPTFGQPTVVVQANGFSAGGSSYKVFYGHDWSPDGNSLLYRESVLQSDGSVQFELRVMSNGTVKPLVQGDATWPSWSASGNRIVFASGGDVRTVRPDGSDPTSHQVGQGGGPICVSPDGTEVAFTKGKTGGGGTGLFVVTIADDSVREVTGPSESVTWVFGWPSLAEYR